MKQLLLFVLCLCYSCENESTNPSKSQTEKPNILLIIADDMGLDASPGYQFGNEKPTMPHLNNFILNGIRFNNLWSYPTCTPTRSSIITGKHGFRTNMKKVGDELAISEISLQKYLDMNNSDYVHAVIGKWHLSSDPTHPTKMGIGYYAGLLTGSAKTYLDWNYTTNGLTVTSNEYATTKFTDDAINWVGSQDKPWFLWIAYNAPHTPFHLPPTNLHSRGNLASDQTSIDANPRDYYMAMIEAMDTEIGRLLNSMTSEVRDNTVIIFIGDNGSPSQVAQEYNNKRVKGTVYHGGINVPMIVSGKGVTRKNSQDNSLINTSDLFITIANIAGINVTELNDSKSFKSLFTNEISNFRSYNYSEIARTTTTSDKTIRNLTHKYILFSDGSDAFFNLKNNPLEKPNLLSSNQPALSNEDLLILNDLKLKLTEYK